MRPVNIARLRMIADGLSADGFYSRGQTVWDAADLIEELMRVMENAYNPTSHPETHGLGPSRGQSDLVGAPDHDSVASLPSDDSRPCKPVV